MPRLLRTLASLCVVVLAATAPVVAQTTFDDPDTASWSAGQRELLAFEHARSDAIARHDTVTLARMYAPDFRGVTAIGYPVDRARLLQVFTLDDPTTVFRIDEIAIQLIGHDQAAAILTARLTTLRRTGEVVARSRFLHVYERREGRWVIVAAQGTLVERHS